VSGSQGWEETVTDEELWNDLMERIKPFRGYKEALDKLSAECPPGYSLVFAFNYVNADISNGGLTQLHANSTWTLILRAIEAAHLAGYPELERLLKEAVLYYHEQGRSRLKRQIGEEFFEGFDRPFTRSISDIEDDYYARDGQRRGVIQALMGQAELWRAS
jgi:hypothetical protein